MSRMWRVQRRAFADEQRRRDHWHERLRLACHESGHAIANLAHWRRKNSIDGPPPDGNPNLARYCTGRTAHIGVWARLVCSLAGEALGDLRPPQGIATKREHAFTPWDAPIIADLVRQDGSVGG